MRVEIRELRRLSDVGALFISSSPKHSVEFNIDGLVRVVAIDAQVFVKCWFCGCKNLITSSGDTLIEVTVLFGNVVMTKLGLFANRMMTRSAYMSEKFGSDIA